MMIGAIAATITLILSMTPQTDWCMVRDNPQHTGFVDADLRPPFRLAWARHFAGERIGSNFEPVVADGKVFVSTHNGNLYALDAESGNPLWRFQANGSFLNSPAFSDGLVVAGNTDGHLYGLNSETGELRWSISAGQGGFAASPVISDGMVFIGSRAGDFLAADLSSGRMQWRHNFDVSVRQTAAVADGKVFVTAEDLRVRCIDAETGMLLWVSGQLAGQTARDYYPVIVNAGGRTFVVVRTNPVVHMANLIGQDRRLLTQQAGLGDAGWREIDAWAKSEQARGTEELWRKEQEAIVNYLKEYPHVRTFFVLDAETGKESSPAPVLWIAGCQGVGTPPVALPGGRLLVFYRSAYGNWNHGVAPLVALGILDLAENRIEPLFHDHGMRPPWNTFWGTADESQNFLVAGDTLLIIHQGTLSGFDLRNRKLFLIGGNRDTWGGFHNLPWARNEWHGPARGGVAVADNRIYWQTGSRILCIASGEEGEAAADIGINGNDVPVVKAPMSEERENPGNVLQKRLVEAVKEFLSRRWAALYVEPGLAAREFFFDDSGEVFESLAWAYPYLPGDLQSQVKEFLASEWEQYQPFTQRTWYRLNDGERRELFQVPEDLLSRWHSESLPLPFSNVYAAWLYAERCGEWDRVLSAWPSIRASFDDFVQSDQKDGFGTIFANRYLASLIALSRIAEKKGEAQVAHRAQAMADEKAQIIIEWWRKGAQDVNMPVFQNISEWDSFLGKGDPLFFKVSSHRAKLRLFYGLTPEVANIITSETPDAAGRVWRLLEVLCPTWYLMGEERQVHYGENFVDPPDFALSAFKAMAWLKDASGEGLAQRVDIPFCRADLSYITKLAVALERSEVSRP